MYVYMYLVQLLISAIQNPNEVLFWGLTRSEQQRQVTSPVGLKSLYDQ